MDGRSDLWSLGATMFAALTGREVHVAAKAHEILLASMTKRAQPIQELLPELPDQVADIVDRALAFTPGDRFPSARVMQEWVREARPAPPELASLPEAQMSQPATIRPVTADNALPPFARRPSRWPSALLVALALASAAFVGAPALLRGQGGQAALWLHEFRDLRQLGATEAQQLEARVLGPLAERAKLAADQLHRPVTR